MIPILDKFVESSSEALSPPHETPTTDDTLSDVIDKIGRLNLDSVPTQSTEQLDHLRKVPQSGWQRHLKVFILMRLERQELEIQNDKMDVM